jgi:hypothetical protein
MGGISCAERNTSTSNRVHVSEDRIADLHVVGQIGHVVAFALAVGVVLHAVERQVDQAHLIVAIAYQRATRTSRWRRLPSVAGWPRWPAM